MFCGSCEQILAKDEKLFAERVFFPRHEETDWLGFDYEPWLLRFAVGVALRVAFGHYDETGQPTPGPGDRVLKERAVPAWRAFLLDEAPSSGIYEFHLVLLDYVAAATFPTADRLQWYLMRAFDQTYVWSRSGSASLYALIPGFVFWVPLVPKRQTGWHGTRVHMTGRIAVREQVFDGAVFEFMNERSQAISEMSDDMPADRLEALTRRLARTGERALDSKSAEVVRAQAELQSPPGRPRSDLQLPSQEQTEASREAVRRRMRRRRR
jgi:hypothetical protein